MARSWFAFVLALIGLCLPSRGQCQTYSSNPCGTLPGLSGPQIANGVLTVGTSTSLGGTIVLVEENAIGSNLVNNLDTGRQIQSALFDIAPPWQSSNPTQAGSGYVGNTLTDPGEYIDFTGTYIVSRSTPALFDYQCSGPTSVSGIWFTSWTEFLSPSEPAFSVKTLLTNEATYAGYAVDQQLIPTVYLNRDSVALSNPCTTYRYFDRYSFYQGSNPWTDDELSIDLFPPAPNQAIGTSLNLTEHWMAVTDENDWGVALMSNSAAGNATSYDGPTPPGDLLGTYQNPTRNAYIYDRFPIHRLVDPATGQSTRTQYREGRAIIYVGEVQAARDFFKGYAPANAGAYDERFAAGFERDWDANSHPIVTQLQGTNGVILLETPSPASHKFYADLSLRDRVWRQATYQVNGKREFGIRGRWGLVINKSGNQHFNALSGGYWIYLRDDALSRMTIALVNTDGTFTALGYIDLVDFDADQWHTLTVQAALVAGDYPPADAVLITATVGYLTPSGNPRVQVLMAKDDPGSYNLGYCSLAADLPPSGQNTIGIAFDDFVVVPTPGESADSTSPAAAVFSAPQVAPGQATLSWSNPATDWLWTRIVRSVNQPGPAHHRDGVLVYEGRLGQFRDVNLSAGTYYYGIYTVDRAGNWTQGQTINVTVP